MGGGKGAAPPPPPGGGKGGGKADPEEAKRKREAEKEKAQKQKEKEKETIAYLDGLWRGTPAEIDAVNWASAARLQLLAGGTSVQELGDGRLVCVRRPPQAAAELLAHRIAALLEICVPRFRLVRPDEEEYASIAEATARATTYLEDMPMVVEDFVRDLKEANGGVGMDLPTEVKRPLIEKFEFTEPTRCAAHFNCEPMLPATLFVMEFLPGRGLDNVGGVFEHTQLWDVGRIAALDAMLNFNKQLRLPLWAESGKLSNIMVRMSDGEKAIVAVDQHVVPIDDEDKLHQYALRLKKLVRIAVGPNNDSCVDPNESITVAAVLHQTRELFASFGFDVPEASLSVFLSGLAAGFQSIADKWASGALPKALEAYEAEAAARLVLRPDALAPGPCLSLVRSTAQAIESEVRACRVAQPNASSGSGGGASFWSCCCRGRAPADEDEGRGAGEGVAKE